MSRTDTDSTKGDGAAKIKQDPLLSDGHPGVDHVSMSLRRAYQNTLDEIIPDTMMDLLKRLD